MQKKIPSGHFAFDLDISHLGGQCHRVYKLVTPNTCHVEFDPTSLLSPPVSGLPCLSYSAIMSLALAVPGCAPIGPVPNGKVGEHS